MLLRQSEYRDGAEDCDRADPMQQHLMEILPRSPCRLDQHAGFGVGNVGASFDAGGLLQQRLFIDDAGRWVRGAIRTEFLA